MLFKSCSRAVDESGVLRIVELRLWVSGVRLI